MSIDLHAAFQFLEANARILDRHRAAALLADGPTAPVLDALRPYQNPDGGFGHALEPDIRCPASQPASTLAALEVLAEINVMDTDLTLGAVEWLASIANSDGGLPTVLPSAEGHPRGPWMQPSATSGFLTFAVAARLWHLGVDHAWLDKATEWCWHQIDTDEAPGGYTVKFALQFLDSVPNPVRASSAVERLRAAIRADGTVPVEGGIEDEKIAPLDLSPFPGAPSRSLFTDEQVSNDLDRLEAGQLDDGGWDFDFLHWSPAQSVEWRGLATIHAVSTLRLHGRA
ncbi:MULTISPECIES: hypothetical protein [Nocardioides]|uniref:Prenyltransferase n=1 Tax=Nocardioides vastitatis TaxID=2568655 RepID=A0ABW0ZLN2_9ACTN|nr:hypothetical protein [Nocardioides sp.]THJ08457.1 hypothetical protein E7Z54_04525 [Nocardioides sp.]